MSETVQLEALMLSVLLSSISPKATVEDSIPNTQIP